MFFVYVLTATFQVLTTWLVATGAVIASLYYLGQIYKDVFLFLPLVVLVGSFLSGIGLSVCLYTMLRLIDKRVMLGKSKKSNNPFLPKPNDA